MKFVAVTAALAALVVTASVSARTFSTRSLSDARVGTSKTELLAQRDFSQREIRQLSGTWKVAPRHATCWSHVPWSRTCDRTRRTLLEHRWLYKVAVRKLDRLYPSSQIPSWLWSAFMCIHRYEGGWADNTHNGYEGGLQFGAAEWATYGSQYAPAAYLATPAQQIEAGIAYYHADGNSFAPWPNTARACGLL